MPLHIVRNDITKMKVDAIVNAANSTLLGGGGVDGCIHRAAGPELLKECETLGGCHTGSAKITGAGRLPCKYVIHAVGPRWMGGNNNEREKLASCYDTSLALALEHGCESVAFPLISSGIFGYPKDQALRVAVERISGFLMQHDMTVYIVIFDRNAYQISSKVFSDITEYIDDNYAEKNYKPQSRRLEEELEREKLFWQSNVDNADEYCSAPMVYSAPEAKPKPVMPAFLKPMAAGEPKKPKESLDEIMNEIDESFSEMLLRKIDESGMTDAQCYRKANIDRKLFSKIRSDKLYKPSKPTALAFAIALELSLEETREMLGKAGFALSPSIKFDVIIEYFIKQKNYDVFQINEALFAFDQNLLGA